MQLTPRQRQVLEFIESVIEERGSAPTRAAIVQAFGFRSPNAAESHLRALQRKGVIELRRGASRGIQLKTAGGLPVIGRVAAGSPILAEAHVEARYRVDPRLFRPRADYLLRVRGLSMRDAGILDGDLLAVHRTAEAADGALVVARVDGEVTVKRLQYTASGVRLLPANPDFQPLELDPQRHDLVLEGIAVGLLRAGERL